MNPLSQAWTPVHSQGGWSFLEIQGNDWVSSTNFPHSGILVLRCPFPHVETLWPFIAVRHIWCQLYYPCGSSKVIIWWWPCYCVLCSSFQWNDIVVSASTLLSSGDESQVPIFKNLFGLKFNTSKSWVQEIEINSSILSRKEFSAHKIIMLTHSQIIIKLIH